MVVQSPVFEQMVILRQVEIDLNNIVVRNVFFNMFPESLEQLGLAAASNAGDDLDVGRADDIDELFQIATAGNEFHDAFPLES